MKVFIVTEGGSNIGFGHITRCVSFYEAFEEKDIRPVFIINGDGTIKDLLKGKDYQIFNWLEDKNRLFELVKDSDVAIIDSYLADSSTYECLANIVKLVVYIDDFKRLNYPSGIVLNGGIYAEGLDYPKKDNMKYLLGNRYTPLRKPFWETCRRAIKENIEKVMVTFGGDDSKNVTLKIIRLLKEKFPNLKKNLIIGKAFGNINELKGEVEKNTDLIYCPDAEEMKKVMLESDVAISSGGQTLYELARMGVPTIAICVAENQVLNLETWHEKGFIEYVGWYNEPALGQRLYQTIDNFFLKNERVKRSEIGMRLIDGQGSRRAIIDIISQSGDFDCSITSDGLKLRDIRPDDIDELFQWRNHPDIRKNFFNTKPVSWNEHKKWFDMKINDEDSAIYMAFLGKDKIGSIRFEPLKDMIKTSVVLSPLFIGKGLGPNLIKMGVERFTLNGKGKYKTILAQIKKGNVISIKAFKKAGFIERDVGTGTGSDFIEMIFKGKG